MTLAQDRLPALAVSATPQTLGCSAPHRPSLPSSERILGFYLFKLPF